MAGQGGYGIQMAPALAKIAATLAQSKSVNFDEKSISPLRFS
jgi:glycine/D-amino acid oxidase-like deaminating enzyme